MVGGRAEPAPTPANGPCRTAAARRFGIGQALPIGMNGRSRRGSPRPTHRRAAQRRNEKRAGGGPTVRRDGDDGDGRRLGERGSDGVEIAGSRCITTTTCAPAPAADAITSRGTPLSRITLNSGRFSSRLTIRSSSMGGIDDRTVLQVHGLSFWNAGSTACWPLTARARHGSEWWSDGLDPRWTERLEGSGPKDRRSCAILADMATLRSRGGRRRNRGPIARTCRCARTAGAAGCGSGARQGGGCRRACGPVSCARRATAWPRRVTCSFCRMLCMWFFTVAQLIVRSRAISLFERPSPARLRISLSREVSVGSSVCGSAVHRRSARRWNIAAAMCASTACGPNWHRPTRATGPLPRSRAGRSWKNRLPRRRKRRCRSH